MGFREHIIPHLPHYFRGEGEREFLTKLRSESKCLEVGKNPTQIDFSFVSIVVVVLFTPEPLLSPLL